MWKFSTKGILKQSLGVYWRSNCIATVLLTMELYFKILNRKLFQQKTWKNNKFLTLSKKSPISFLLPLIDKTDLILQDVLVLMTPDIGIWLHQRALVRKYQNRGCQSNIINLIMVHTDCAPLPKWHFNGQLNPWVEWCIRMNFSSEFFKSAHSKRSCCQNY